MSVQLLLTPEQAFRRWPRGTPLVALLSCGRTAGDTGANPRSRWSILARPIATCTRYPGDPDPLKSLRDALGPRDAACGLPDGPPFRSGWIGAFSYDLGAVIEPAAKAPGRVHRQSASSPLLELHRCDGAYVHDALTDRWWATGDPSGLPPIDSLMESHSARAPAHLGSFTSDTGRRRFKEQVSQIIELIRAGDVFQVNLAHRLRARFEGDARALFSRLLNRAEPWYGAYLESPRGPTLSLSPELFFDFDAASRLITTRPMKGTRAGAADPAELLASAKDAAELHMIIDLMRNDLGRVCEYGSIRVDQARAVEAHGGSAPSYTGVLQTVATVSGRLRENLDVIDLLRAAFPAGSVTGAPKVRAMQIIDELEPVCRGPYCGAIGYIADSGCACFSVAIRTATITWEHPPHPSAIAPHTGRGTLHYSVGAGIVADSDPGAEWRETLLKAGPLLGRRNTREPGGPEVHPVRARKPQVSHA